MAPGTERVPGLWNQAPVVWSGASGIGSGPLITRLYGFATRENQGATPELHHLWGQPLEQAGCLWRGMATALLAAEWGDESLAACSQLCLWFALITSGKSSLFP